MQPTSETPQDPSNPGGNPGGSNPGGSNPGGNPGGSNPGGDPGGPPAGPPDDGRRNAALAIAAAVGVVVVVGLLAWLLTRSDDDGEIATATTTTAAAATTEAPATSTSTTTTTGATTTTQEATPTTAVGTVTPEEAATIVWPDPSTGGYEEPTRLAADFATRLLGFSNPVIGEYQQGDSRSGEFEVRPLADGPVTTVAVRQMSDDRFYVLFAATSEVELTAPTSWSAIDHPLQVEGRGRGFEGRIRIAVFDRVAGTELGSGFVTGGGSGQLEPFTGEIAWNNPGGGWGVVMASVNGGEQGTTWAATVIPVGFIGGD